MLRSFSLMLLLVACNSSSSSPGSASSSGADAQQAALNSGDGGTNVTDVTEAELEQMSPAALQALYTQRKEQDTVDQQELQLKQALSAAMCQQYQQITSACVSLTPLVVSQYNQSIDCQGGITVQSAVQQTIQVTVTGTASGKFILVANNQSTLTPFQTTPFGSGTTTVTFIQKVGRAIAPPTFGELSTLYLASATDNATIPDISNFKNFSIQINGKTLMQGDLLPYPDPDYRGTRYNVPLDAVTQMRRSATCSMTQSDVSALTKKISDSVTSQQAIDQEKSYVKNNAGGVSTQTAASLLDKKTIIASILQYEASVNTREPVLEKTRDTLLKLTNVLTQNQDVGCHYNDIVQSLKIRINGAQNTSPEYVGSNSNMVLNPKGTGGCNDFTVDFGSIKQTFNQNNQSIYQENLLDFPPNSATIGSLSFIRLKKNRICYKNDEDFHTSYIVLSSSDYKVYELNIFNINSVEVTVNGALIYQNNSLGLSLRGPTQLGQGNYVLDWSDSLQNNNPLWTAFMNKQDCNNTK